MTDRRQERLDGWLGGFIWVAILTVIFAVQGRVAEAAAGCAIAVAEVLTVVFAAPWRHPHTRFRVLLAPIYLLFAVALAWAVWAAEDIRELGVTNWWTALVLLPALMPLWTTGGRTWDGSDGNA